jgi:leucyl-tRNA synthetase
MAGYNHKKIEAKWQKEWAKKGLYKTKDNTKNPKCYVLDMFPYPSGDGLHVGHPKGYIATDIYSRFKKMSGFSVLHPMGWDAFGLPAENFAIKNKIHPRVSVEKNIKRFKEQLSILGFNYDWSREVNTTDPAYYKWTQWIFLQLFKKGLAYESYEPINWCPSCQTGLANEDVEDGLCERCGTVVEKKPMRQWVLSITKYADRLLNDLEKLNWPESIKESQRNWIGKSEGAMIQFPIFDSQFSIKVFTTRPDTLFGATYMVLAPEHELVQTLKPQIQNWKEVEIYIKKTKNKTEIERTTEGKEKTGVELQGVKAINPANKKEIPIFIADYVLAHYGTGAIMAVPAHDERDWEFADKYKLRKSIVVRDPNQEIILETGERRKILSNGDIYYNFMLSALSKSVNIQGPIISEGALVNSGKFDGMQSEDAKKKITEFVGGKMTTQYKLRDWVFSRQRYWGEPIPLVHCTKCGVVPVPEKDLPIKLPDVKSYAPTGTGESPLADINKWVNTKCPKCKGPAKRETNTMPQWAGSSWYYLRYIDPKNKKVLVDKKKEKYWSPVDLYVGGAEHATRHLIYARFWHKFLYDIGAVNYTEPFSRLQHVGLIMAEDGRKMSKRFGNVINPDDMIKKVGADTLRMYEMFLGPFDQAASWSTQGILGPRRFLDRVYHFSQRYNSKTKNNTSLVSVGTKARESVERLLHKTIKKVSEDIEMFHFNTAISQLMILLNECEKLGATKEQFQTFLQLLAPFAPHMTEELWNNLGGKSSIHLMKWPTYNTTLLVDDVFNLVVQVNGKYRDKVEVATNTSQEEATKLALNREAVIRIIGGATPKKVIFVPRRLINIVV